MVNTISDPLVKRLVDGAKLEFILKGLGLCLRDFAREQFFPNTLWKELGWGEDLHQFEDWTTLLHPDDQAKVFKLYEEALNGKCDTFETEFRLKNRHNQWKWIHHRAIVLERGKDQKPTLFASVDIDITSYQEKILSTQALLHDIKQKYWQAETFRIAGIAMACDLNLQKAVDNLLVQAHHILPFDAASVWLYDADRLFWAGGCNLEQKDLISLEENTEIYLQLKEEHKPLLVKNYDELYPQRFLQEKKFQSWIGISLILQNQVIGFLEFFSICSQAFHLDHLWGLSIIADQAAVVLSNCTRYRSSQIEASTDALTGFLTRRSFERLIARSLQQKKDTTATVMLLDLDRFKQINDYFGHAAGDEALRRTAMVCRSVLRENDLICRWGGEEIAVFLQGSHPTPTLNAAERIRRGIEDILLDDFPTLRMSVSIGVACFLTESLDTLQQVLQRADKALYLAKQQGRNKVIFYDETLQA